MLCYKGTTFCTGGSPRCSKFLACSRALTDQHRALSEASGLPVSTFVAPEAMPCYAAPSAIRLPELRKSDAPKTRFRPNAITDDAWRALFLEEPRRDDHEMARGMKCSVTTIRAVRVRLGIPSVREPGQTRHTRYTEADALRVIHARRDGDTCLRDAARRAGVNNNLLRHLRQRFRTTFENHGL